MPTCICMIKLRPLNYEYALEIDKIWKEYWSEYTLPDQSASIIDTVVTNGEKVIAYGQVRHFAEMMYFPDMSTSRRVRMDALKAVIEEGYRGVELAGLRDVYMMCKDIGFARLVAKHFGFQLFENPGVLLAKRLGE
jgi:hypothetical protein